MVIGRIAVVRMQRTVMRMHLAHHR
jgi:hypothetical protein